MLELADWGGLTYYMLREETPTEHLILVQDEAGNTTIFNLENCEEVAHTFQMLLPLDSNKKKQAKRMIHDFRKEFIEYWNKMKPKRKAQ